MPDTFYAVGVPRTGIPIKDAALDFANAFMAAERAKNSLDMAEGRFMAELKRYAKNHEGHLDT